MLEATIHFESELDYLLYIISPYLYLLIVIVIFSIIATIIDLRIKKRTTSVSKKLIDNDFYFRDIPFDTIEEAYAVGAFYGLIDNPSDFIGAMILKWLDEDKIDIININNSVTIDMTKIFKVNSEFESQIYIYLLKYASIDRYLDEKEFTRCFSNNQNEIEKLFDKFQREIIEKYKKEGVITSRGLGNAKKFKSTPALDEKAKKLAGLKNFLINFSTLEEKESIEVEVWNQYMIYAQMLGIADKVENEFSRLYPNYNKMTKINTFKRNLITQMAAGLKACFSTADSLNLLSVYINNALNN